MPFNIRLVTTYPPRRCGIGTFSRDLANALSHFTAEIGHIRVAAIDHSKCPYNIPVDLTIEQYNTQSWNQNTNEIISKIRESANPTIVVLQHEYGLDPDENKNDCKGMNYVKMARAFAAHKIICITYLHTVLDKPDPHQKLIIQQLAQSCDGLVVTTESAIDILTSDQYSIDPAKLKHIDHGIRMQNPSQFDRLEIKEKFGLNDHFVATTLGLLSPGKGLEVGLTAYGKFIKESCTPQQRKKIVYLIAGQCHPDFITNNSGKDYRNYLKNIENAIKQAQLEDIHVKELNKKIDYDSYDVVFLESYLEEDILMSLYGATNVMILPYLNQQQISSGILADTLGAGRATIATKFMYAQELINSNKSCPPGVVIGRHARGILVDTGNDCANQIAKALDFLVFNTEQRLRMEKQAHQRGYQMRWINSAWAFIQYIQFLKEERDIVTGRGMRFKRVKSSKLQQRPLTVKTSGNN